VALHPDNYEAAAKHLEVILRERGEKLQEKLGGRVTKQGLVCAVTGDEGRAILLEVSCETDFVSRTGIFRSLTHNIATSFLLEQPHSPDEFQQFLGDTIQNATARLGENIGLRRLVKLPPNSSQHAWAYVHGSDGEDNTNTGTIASVIVMEVLNQKRASEIEKTELGKLGRGLAKHVAGFAPQAISWREGMKQEDALEEQAYLLGGGGGKLVKEVLEEWKDKVRLVCTRRIAVGEPVGGGGVNTVGDEIIVHNEN